MTSTLEIGIGDEVRASFPGGLFVRGPVQEVNGEQVKVRGRWFRKEDATPAEEIENRIHANEAAERTRRANEQAGIEAAKVRSKSSFDGREQRTMKVVAEKKELSASETDDFVSSLLATGYRLRVAAREDGIEKARDEYREWTVGEELPDGCMYVNDTALTAREWFLDFEYDDGISYPFPIIEMGTVGKMNRTTEAGGRALHHNGKVTACYTEIAEFVIRAGVRASNDKGWRR